MKLWKVLARNSHVYNNGVGQEVPVVKAHKVPTIELHELKSMSPTFSEDSGKPSSTCQENRHGPFTTTVQIRKRAGENLGIILSPGEFPHFTVFPLTFRVLLLLFFCWFNAKFASLFL